MPKTVEGRITIIVAALSLILSLYTSVIDRGRIDNQVSTNTIEITQLQKDLKQDLKSVGESIQRLDDKKVDKDVLNIILEQLERIERKLDQK